MEYPIVGILGVSIGFVTQLDTIAQGGPFSEKLSLTDVARTLLESISKKNEKSFDFMGSSKRQRTGSG